MTPDPDADRIVAGAAGADSGDGEGARVQPDDQSSPEPTITTRFSVCRIT
jgi:hypothetical protein